MNVMFVGPMGSGKTFYSNILIDQGYKRVALADPIKDMERQLERGKGLVTIALPYINMVPEYGTEEAQLLCDILQNAADMPHELPKPRARLQYIGTEGGRDMIDQDIWIKILKGTVESEPDTNWVCDDCRFVNEYELLKDSFIPIKLLIDEETQLARLNKDYPNFDPKVLEHASEQDIKNIHPRYTIDGTLSLEDATRRLEEIINESHTRDDTGTGT